MENLSKDTANQVPLFSIADIENKRVFFDFDGADVSSDGGILLLKEVDNQIGLVQAMAEAIDDERDQRYVQHEIMDLLLQRICQIAAGYEDANDCDTLRKDPVLKMVVGRLPQSGPDLASQPTHSRFENAIARKSLYKLGCAFVDAFIQSYEKAPDVIVLDFDDTEDKVHGGQQLGFFNGYFNQYCFLPLHIYEGLSGKLVATILRPGHRSSGEEVKRILERLVKKLREAWPNTLILFRGDSHFASPDVFSWIETQENMEFVTGLASNEMLQKMARPIVEKAKERYERLQTPIKLFYSFRYQARSWARPYRIILKLEINEKGKNLRFVVTSLEEAKASVLYNEIYCSRGKAEQYIKEHKLHLKSDRTSCSRFSANQFRLFLHSAAYVLMHALRSQILQHTQWANATFQTIRLRLFKIGTRVRELKTRIKVDFPASCPVKDDLVRSFLIFEVLRSSA